MLHLQTDANFQVQLSTIHAVSFNVPSAIVSSPDAAKSAKILALIEDEERKYQISLNETYQEMKEKTFKGLRRALPLTRQKIDWDKVDHSFERNVDTSINLDYR